MTGTAQIKLKVCGMRDAANILDVAALGPDLMGFIFFRGSKRYVGNDFLLPPSMPANIKKVGVFVDQSPAEINLRSQLNKLDYVQLHGSESVAVCDQIKASGVGVIKVFPVDNEFDFSTTKPFEGHADYFLFDTKTPQHGGSGKQFDWTLLENYNQRVPFFLSGGLSAENIPNIKFLTSMNLAAIDINSAVETSPGLKDIAKIKQITTLLHQP